MPLLQAFHPSRTPAGIIGVTSLVQMVVYYDRSLRTWWAYYTDNDGFQLGDAWFGFKRDEVLVQRPPTPHREG